jgi:hypothetical protein
MTAPARPSGAILALLLLVSSGLVHPAGGMSQELPALVESCGGASEALSLLCHRAALALDAGRGGLGTAASRGSEIYGSASTLGYRLRSSPRLAVSARAGVARFSMVDLRDRNASHNGTDAEGFFVPSLSLAGAVGLFTGFSPAPTVGGILSLDVTGSTHWIFAPKGRGFQEGLLGWGLGVRMGVLRESFTLPGVSVSLTRRWLGSTAVGNVDRGDPAEAVFDLNVTSIRGVVGKDLFGFGLLAGFGWDRDSGGGTIRARVPAGGPEGDASASDLVSKRMVFFGGVSRTFLILQISGEVGWSRALDPDLPREPGTDSFPSSRAYFASIAARLTF